jgi:hypothetical protein
MNPDIQQMQRDIEELKAFKEAMLASSSLPIGFENAVRERLRIDTFTPLETNSKASNSENQAVNEGGSATYQVLGSPNGYLKLSLSGGTYYIAYWT